MLLYRDNGLFFAAHQNAKFKIGYLGNVKTLCFGGEGFIMKFRTLFTFDNICHCSD